MQTWFPGEMDCIRFCSLCLNSCDREDLRGASNDLLHRKRREIRNHHDSQKIVCLGIFYCKKGKITIVDINWTNDSHSICNAIPEIINIMSKKYVYEGKSDILFEKEILGVYKIHLYFKLLK